MENELIINGVSYIKKDSIKTEEYKVLKEEINTKLKLVNKEINNMIDKFINDENIESVTNTVEVTDDMINNLNIFPSARVLYQKVTIDNEYIRIGNKSTKYTIAFLKDIRKKIDDKTLTNEDMKVLATRFHVNLVSMHRLVYNVFKGVFDKLLVEKKTDVFEPHTSACIPYQIKVMNNDGTLQTPRNILGFNIQQIIRVKLRIVDKHVNRARANQVASDLNLTYHTLARIVYNINIGTFDKYIDEWRRRINESPVGEFKKIKVQNNPEKRIEQGYYGSVGGY